MKDIQLFNDSFQNYKSYQIPKAQLILTDVPYVLGKNAYASNPVWYVDGDNTKGERATRQESSSSHLTANFARQSSCTSAPRC